MESEAGHWVCGYEVGHVLTIYTVALGGVTRQATQEESGLFVSEMDQTRGSVWCALSRCVCYSRTNRKGSISPTARTQRYPTVAPHRLFLLRHLLAGQRWALQHRCAS